MRIDSNINGNTVTNIGKMFFDPSKQKQTKEPNETILNIVKISNSPEHKPIKHQSKD